MSKTGWEPGVAYVVNANLQLTFGWQHLLYWRSEGVFTNGGAGIAMRAEFLHVLLKFWAARTQRMCYSASHY